MDVQKLLRQSILGMGLQRFIEIISQFIVTGVVVRSLARSEYGILAVVLSYGVLFNALNVSASSVLLRDYTKIKPNLSEHLSAYLLFSLIKSLLLLIATAGLGIALGRQYHSTTMQWVLWLTSVGLVISYFTEPFAMVLSVQFNQRLLTRYALIANVLNIVLTAGAILFPSAAYIAAKNSLVLLSAFLMPARYVLAQVPIHGINLKNSSRIIYKSLVEFSVWSHLTGVMMDIIYRADALILGWLGAPLGVIGNYSVALQIANMTKPIPQILQYHATLGLSQTSLDTEEKHELTWLFVKYSLLISLAIFGGYSVLGLPVIRLLTGTDGEQIYRMGLFIVGGLCVFNAFRPLISYAFVHGDVRATFMYVIVPSSLMTVACYVVMGKVWGAFGLAVANLISGSISSVVTLVFMQVCTSFVWRPSWIGRSERLAIRRILDGVKRAIS